MSRLVAGALIALSVSTSAEARTWHVTADGTGDAPTIQAAIDSTTSGDSVVVAAGIYDENLAIPANKNLALLGAGAGISIIDGGRRDSVIRVFGEGSIEGFTIRTGQASFGAGVFIQGSDGFTLRNNTIEDNWAGIPDFGNGGGIHLDFSRGIVIESNIIRDNLAGDVGGGVALGAFDAPLPILRNNTIKNNWAVISGGGVAVGFGTVEGNLIEGNQASFGGGVRIGIGGTVVVRNNTIVNNTIENPGGGAGIGCAGPATITDNIVAYNGTFGTLSAFGISCTSQTAPTIDCNDTWGNDIDAIFGLGVGPNNFSADPLFCDPASSNFTLDENSPCLPAQNPTCGLVGAFPAACKVVAVEQHSWSAVKSLYRD